MINTAIVVTDVQIAVKANRYANEGFYFCAMGSAYPKVKFDTIVFSCVLSTEVIKKWAINFVKTSLKADGKVCGFATPTEVTEATEVLEKVLDKIDPENDPEAILAKAETEAFEKVNETLPDMSKSYRPRKKVKKKSKRKMKRLGKNGKT
jgi:hypothetical protein